MTEPSDTPSVEPSKSNAPKMTMAQAAEALDRDLQGSRSARGRGRLRSHFIVLLRERRPSPSPASPHRSSRCLSGRRASGQISNDMPLTTLVESLLVLVGACRGQKQPPGSDTRT